MKFGLNQSGISGSFTAESAAMIAKSGYDGFEPNLQPDGPLHTDSERTQIVTTAADHDLTIPSISTTVHWEYSLTSDQEEVRRRGIELGKTMIEAAAAMDADTVLIVPGVLESEPTYDVAYDRALESVRELAEAGADADVTIGIENVGNDLLVSPLEFREFIDRANENGPVGAYFDVGNAYYYQQRPDHWIRILGDRVENVHVKGWIDGVGTTVPLVGEVDWPAVSDALDDIGYDGWVTAEVPPYDHAPDLTIRHVLESIKAVL